MGVAAFLRVCRKRWMFIVVPLLAAAIAAVLVSSLTPRVYEASSSTYFSLPYAQSANDLFQGSNYTQQQLASYASLATTPLVLEAVIEDLDLSTTPDKLAKSVVAEASVDTVIVTITASSTDPSMAASIANTVVAELATVVVAISPEGANGKPAIVATIVARASVPSVPSSPNTKLNLAAGLLGGLFLGVLAALGREHMDTRVRGAQDIPPGVSVLASIEFDRAARRMPILSGTAEQAVRAESFRRLRTNLRFANIDHPAKVVVVTSSIAGEGKSSTAINLSLVCAKAGERVILVDTDLRRPRVAGYLGLEGAVGLVDVLAGEVVLEDVLIPWPDSTLIILPSGSRPPNPSELLGSHAMAELLSLLRQSFDRVILDTPPLLPVTDAALLAAEVDGVLLVSRHGLVRRHEVATAVESLRSVSGRILGSVLTMVPQRGNAYSYSDDASVEEPLPSEQGLSR